LSFRCSFTGRNAGDEVQRTATISGTAPGVRIAADAAAGGKHRVARADEQPPGQAAKSSDRSAGIPRTTSRIWDMLPDMGDAMTDRLAARVAGLRTRAGWSLDDLAARTGISRSTLSRLENGRISPTAALLGKLCTAYGWTTSRLLAEVEAEPPAVVRAADQTLWRDDTSGFERRAVSPPHPGLRGELIEATLAPGADIAYDAPGVPGLEQHVWILDGALELTDDGRRHHLTAGDCLRFRLWGATRFRNTGATPVRYAVLMVLP
jgi:transcriptional regulator with XRE-family HTH domain